MSVRKELCAYGTQQAWDLNTPCGPQAFLCMMWSTAL